MSDFDKVKGYLAELGLTIAKEDAANELVVISDESQGINNLVIDCETPILILEQHVLTLKAPNETILRRLLQMNRNMVHGAFVLDESGTQVLFRDTLQLENLDLNELQGSVQALSLAMAENAEELIHFANA